jgi:phage terminase large subunit
MSAAVAPVVQNPFEEFLAKYAHDWVALVREVLGGDPDQDQQDVLTWACNGERRISIVSGHGVGKTTTLAWCIVCHALTRFPQITLATAPTSGQLFDALAAQTKAWFKRLPGPLQEIFEIQVEEIRHRGAPDESFISFATSKAETPEALAGRHSEHMLIIPDEASGVPEPVFEAAAGSMSGENATTILAGNPIRTSGLFFDTHHKLRGLWKTKKISCVGHPRISPDFIEDMKRRYGEGSNAYRVRVLGEFPTGDEDTVIPYELVETALHRDVKATMVREVWGLDVGRFGNDPSALARRKGNTLVKPVEEKKGYDTMRLVGWVKSEYDAQPDKQKPSEILVDVIGLGAGVLDRLVELGLPARGINVSEAPAIFSERYINQRAELWFAGREWFGAKDCNLAGDESLMEELIGPRFSHQSNGKIKIESKEDMKKRGVPSPNKADAFLLTLAGNAVSAISGSKGSQSWNQPLKRKIAGIV